MLSDEERRKDLEAAGFVLSDPPRIGRAGKRFRTVICGRCEDRLVHFGHYGDIGFQAPTNRNAAPTTDFNLELDRVWLTCRAHAARCRRRSQTRLMITREEYEALPVDEQDRLRAGLMEARGHAAKIDEVVGHTHRIYRCVAAMTHEQRREALDELAQMLRMLGFAEAADAIESPSWRP